MTSRAFDAWAVPASLDLPEATRASDADGDVSVRYVDASPEWIGRLTTTLASAGERLADRAAEDVARVLGRVGARFLDPDDALRSDALALLAPTAGLSPAMAAAVLDGMAADWTEARLLGLLRAELEDAGTVDGFHGAPDVRTMAVGPRLCVQVVAGSVPGVGVTALVRSLLVKGPTLLKPGRGDVVLPVLYARALAEADAELGDAVAVVYWPGGRRALEAAALQAADVVVAYGSDETVRDVRDRTPITARFVPYHHRISVGIVGRGALGSRTALERSAAEVAEAVALFDQRGCVSPRTIFVEADADVAGAFADAVADRLDRLEAELPTGPLDAAEASAVHQARGTAEMMAAAGDGRDVWVRHGGAAPWTVVLEAGDAVGSCPGRTVRLRPVPDVADVPGLLAPLSPHLQTVGVTGAGGRLEALAEKLGRLGACRIVPFPEVAFPPPWWHHDGRGPLRDLVRWVDLVEKDRA